MRTESSSVTPWHYGDPYLAPPFIPEDHHLGEIAEKTRSRLKLDGARSTTGSNISDGQLLSITWLTLRDNTGCSWHLLMGLSLRQRGVYETRGDSLEGLDYLDQTVLSEGRRRSYGLPADGDVTKTRVGRRNFTGHQLRVIKRQFSYTKVRFRGLMKNTAQQVTLFALSPKWP